MTHPSRDSTFIPSTMPMALCWGKRNLQLGNMICLGQHWHTPQLGQLSLPDPNAWSTAKCNSDCCQVAASDNYHKTSILALMALLIAFPCNQYQVCNSNSRAGQIYQLAPTLAHVYAWVYTWAETKVMKRIGRVWSDFMTLTVSALAMTDQSHVLVNTCWSYCSACFSIRSAAWQCGYRRGTKVVTKLNNLGSLDSFAVN